MKYEINLAIMKKQISFSLVIFFLHISFAFAQNPLVKQWDKRFGGTNAEEISVVKQTSDGGYILGGYSDSPIGGDKTQINIGSWDFWIVKSDSLGNKQWDKNFGGTSHDWLFSLEQTFDGGYILGGYSYSAASGDKTQNTWGGYDYWVIKTDSLGNQLWDKDFGGIGDDFLYSIQQTSDGGYILGGFSGSPISGDKTQNTWGGKDYWMVKIDSIGNKQWDKNFGGTDNDELRSIQQTADGGYILGGYSYSLTIGGDKTQNGWGGIDYWIVKTDSLGNKQWDKDFGGTDYDWFNFLQQSTDKGYIIGGKSRSGISGDKTQNTQGNHDYWIVKTDSLGNKEWDKDYGGSFDDEFYFVQQTDDGGYLLTGDSYSPISGDKTENNLGIEQVWMVKTNSLGDFQWDKTIFTNGHDEQGLAIQSKDFCYVMANKTNSGIGGYKTQVSWSNSYDYWIVKFCDTTLTPTFNIQNSAFNISIFPNPTSNFIYFNQENFTAEIFDLTGRKLLHQKIKGKQLNISNFTSGIYFLKVITMNIGNNDAVQTFKILKQ